MYPKHLQPKPDREGQPRRHCWVTGPGVRYAGIVHEWRNDGEAWWALATYYVEEEASAVTRWVSEREIEPA